MPAHLEISNTVSNILGIFKSKSKLIMTCVSMGSLKTFTSFKIMENVMVMTMRYTVGKFSRKMHKFFFFLNTY